MPRCLLIAVALTACAPHHPASNDPDAAAGDGTLIAPDAAADELVTDPCPAAPPACPAAPADLTRGSGLRTIDRCAFPLALDPPPATDLIDALPAAVKRVTLADVAADLNRTGTRLAAGALPGNAPGVVRAYAWQSGDESVTYWTPQGVTGSFDGVAAGTVGGRKLVLVSWYYTQANDPGSTVAKGVRIAIADVTDPAAIRYRFALLVEPTGTAAAPTFAAVAIHAGGLAWVGDRLYVPVTGSGFRVFDLSRILKLDSLDDRLGRDAAGTYAAYAYQYAIPQIARYRSTAGCAPVFSFVALDRSTTPATLVSGEYSATSIAGRLYRWPLAASGALQLTDRHRIVPDGAWLMAEIQVQGAIAQHDTWWLSSSRPAGGAGELVRTKVGAKSTTLGWSDSPEDLAYDPQANAVWSLSEGLNARYLFAVDRTKL